MKLITYLLLVLFPLNVLAAGKFQNEDFKSQAELEAKGGTKAQLLNDTKVYVTANGLNKRLDEAITNGDIGGGGGGSSENVFSNYNAEGATNPWTCTNATAAISTGNAASPTHNFVLTATAAGGYCEAAFTTLAGRVNHDSYLYYKTTASDVVLGVYLGADPNPKNSATLSAKSAISESSHVTFITDGAATAGKLRVTMPTDTTVVYADDLYAGMNQTLTNQTNEPQYDLTVTGTNWTTVRAVGIPYSTTDGKWRLKFNIRGSVNVATATPLVTIAGITAPSSEQAISAIIVDAGYYVTQARLISATGDLAANAQTTATNWAFSGDVELASKPTWATSTGARTAVTVGTENSNGSVTWNGIAGCAFGATGGVLTNPNCNTGVVAPTGSVISGDDNFELTAKNLKAGHTYEIKSAGNFYASAGTASTDCEFYVTSDGSDRYGSFRLYATSSSAIDGGGGTLGYYTPTSTVSSKKFSVYATRISGDGSCLCEANTMSSRSCTVSINEIYPTVSQPVIVNSVTTEYPGQAWEYWGELDDSGIVNSGSGGWTTSNSSTGRNIVAFTTPAPSTDAYTCGCSSINDAVSHCNSQDGATTKTASQIAFGNVRSSTEAYRSATIHFHCYIKR